MQPASGQLSTAVHGQVAIDLSDLIPIKDFFLPLIKKQEVDKDEFHQKNEIIAGNLLSLSLMCENSDKAA